MYSKTSLKNESGGHSPSKFVVFFFFLSLHRRKKCKHLFKGTNKDPLVQVVSLKIEPLGFVQFSFSLGFYCVGNPLEAEVVDLTVSKARPSLLYRGRFCCVSTVCFLVYVLKLNSSSKRLKLYKRELSREVAPQLMMKRTHL